MEIAISLSRLGMPRRRLISPIFDTKIGWPGNVTRAIAKKRVKSVIYDQILTLRCKVGDNRSGRS